MRFVIVAVLLLVVVGFGLAAVYLGPPGRLLTANSPPDPAIPKALSAEGFGPTPACNAPEAISTVVSLVRDRVTSRDLGLANIRNLGSSPTGADHSCDAEVQTSGGQVRVQYRIVRLQTKDSWQVTASLPGDR